eukprot:TRINITY_DN2895_c0_g1_i1.p1 TRINITY_DN2895_c0_g1~~TRINITY_DN2895_c0_g1_i1.p1  ORF type:complete len:333 (+),score=32.35 TRINITY_DN2895_c0_g1_i1:28-1026(+)
MCGQAATLPDPTERRRATEAGKVCGEAMTSAGPTEPGVWWKADSKWVRYPPDIGVQIVKEYRAGADCFTLSAVKSEKYPNGANYVIDFQKMKQRNVTTGFTRDVRIIRGLKEKKEKSESQSQTESSKTGGLGIGSSVTIDLQQLSSRVPLSDHLNLVLKLPKGVSSSGESGRNPSSNLLRKTLGLLLEKLTRKNFLHAVLINKSSDKITSWELLKEQPCNSYVYGKSSVIYDSFLRNLSTVVEKQESLLENMFEIVEKEDTRAGDAVEFLFSNAFAASDRYFRNPTSKYGVLEMYLAIGASVEGDRDRVRVTKSNVVLLAKVFGVGEESDSD